MSHKHKSKKNNGGGTVEKKEEETKTSDIKCHVGKKWGEDQRVETVRCSLIEEVTIYIDLTPKQKIMLLMEEYDSREWLGYLVGEIDEDGDLIATDLVIPPHSDSCYASAEAEPFHIPEHCIGVIHSHHKMGAFHSGTDESHVDKNFPVSIVVAKGNDGLTFNAKSSQKTPCGKPVSGDATVKYLQPALTFERDDWLKVAKENIDKGQTKVTYVRKDVYPGVQRNFLGGYLGAGATQQNLCGIKNPPPRLDRAAINQLEDREEEGRSGQEKVAEQPDWKKINGATPVKPIITTKMIERLGSRVFDEKRLVLTRAQLTELLEKNPNLCLEGTEIPLPNAEDTWST